MALDPTTPVGKVRLRIGDWSDLTILPDVVVQSALDDCNGNVGRASQLAAQYILATLTAKSHKKLAVVEFWGAEQFDNYLKFITLLTKSAEFSSVAPIPYIGSGAETSKLAQFISDWKAGYQPGAVWLPPGAFYSGVSTANPAPIIVDDNPS